MFVCVMSLPGLKPQCYLLTSRVKVLLLLLWYHLSRKGIWPNRSWGLVTTMLFWSPINKRCTLQISAIAINWEHSIVRVKEASGLEANPNWVRVDNCLRVIVSARLVTWQVTGRSHKTLIVIRIWLCTAVRNQIQPWNCAIKLIRVFLTLLFKSICRYPAIVSPYFRHLMFSDRRSH